MSIDPRLEVRRQEVAEQRAQRNVGRLVGWLLAASVVGALVWLVFSPFFSIARVEVVGVEKSDANSILVAEGVNVGEPMVFLDPHAIGEALATDPWVAEATVVRQWPDMVRVEIVERVPVAWVLDDSGWARRDIDGIPVPSNSEPDPSLAAIRLPHVTRTDSDDDQLLGALEFVENVGGAIPNLEVLAIDGELWAKTEGHEIRLGRPIEMSDKAEVMMAMLSEELPVGAVLILVAPSNPSYDVPGLEEDTEAGGSDG